MSLENRKFYYLYSPKIAKKRSKTSSNIRSSTHQTHLYGRLVRWKFRIFTTSNYIRRNWWRCILMFLLLFFSISRSVNCGRDRGSRQRGRSIRVSSRQCWRSVFRSAIACVRRIWADWANTLCWPFGCRRSRTNGIRCRRWRGCNLLQNTRQGQIIHHWLWSETDHHVAFGKTQCQTTGLSSVCLRNVTWTLRFTAHWTISLRLANSSCVLLQWHSNKQLLDRNKTVYVTRNTSIIIVKKTSRNLFD